jgi:hypothetical protein
MSTYNVDWRSWVIGDEQRPEEPEVVKARRSRLTELLLAGGEIPF